MNLFSGQISGDITDLVRTGKSALCTSHFISHFRKEVLMSNSCTDDIRYSMQKAHCIMKLLEHAACNGETWDRETKELYWSILYDCAKNIRQRLALHSHGYEPHDPFDESAALQEIICGIRGE